MVLAPARFPFEEDGGILALLRSRRAEADAVLPRSLLTSALTLLTLVVVMLIAQTALHRGSGGEIEVPFYPKPRPPGRIFKPISRTTPLPRVVPTKNAEVRAVEDTSQLVSSAVVVGTGAEGTAGQGEPPAGAGGPGEPSGAVDTDPPPTKFIFYEVAPELVTRVAPEYPALARDAGMEGTVKVRLLVGIDGRVKRAEIESSSALFDEATLAATRQWIFTPALSNQHPVAVWVRVPIHFQLH